MKIFSLLILTTLTLGCSQGEGSVQVDVGSAPLANVYLVDLYARTPGLDLVEGEVLTEGTEVTLADVPEGEWALLVQAQNGDGTTISHYQAQVTVRADETTEVTADAYRPGTPGDPVPEVSQSLESFGPNGEVLLSAFYAPGIDSFPAASVDLELLHGDGEEEAETDIVDVSNRQDPDSPVPLQCGTCFISEADVTRANAEVRAQQIRPQVSSIEPGGFLDFFVITSFETVSCQRLLEDAQTENCLIFAEVVNGSPVITEASALAIAQGFDSDNPFQESDAGIYDDTRARLGSEWRVDGGRDGDERVVLLFLSASSIGGDGLFGFFNPNDQLSSSESSSSNGGEILYVNAQRTTDIYDALSTISHELTHLIIYNQKVAQNGTFPEGAVAENAVIDEGLAVLNEELSGFGFTGEQGGNSFLLGSVSNFLESGMNRRYFQFTGQFGDYGAGYFLWRFVHDQKGLDTVTALATSTEVGRQNFRTVIPQNFEELFRDLGQALATNAREDVPSTLQFTSLDLFQTYQVRGGNPIELNGLQDLNSVNVPGDLDVNQSLEPWGTVFYTANGGNGSALNWKAIGAESLFTGLLLFDDTESF